MSFFTKILRKESILYPQLTSHHMRQSQKLYPELAGIFSLPRSFSSLPGQKRSYSSFQTYTNEGFTMHKTKRIALALIAGVLLAAPVYISACPQSKLEPVTSSDVKGIDWVQICMNQYPEILWLADENVRKTEEGQEVLQGSYSEQLFGKKFVEFDRTIMTLYCLRLMLDGSDEAYQKWTEAQPESVKLSRESFAMLHAQGISLLKSKYEEMSESEMIQAMEASLVLGDIGKSEKARAIFRPYGAEAPDHDDFHEEVIQILQKHPKLCPTFDQLTPSAKKLITQTANLAHYGHITHIEGGPSMFSRLKQSGIVASSPIALSFDFFVHTCDVAGALGHVNNQSSLVYTEMTHLAMQAMFDSCKVLGSSQKTEMDAYNAYLATRANWLGLNVEDQIDRVIARVSAMLRLSTREYGAILRQSIQALPPEMQIQIIEQLDFSEKEELDRTPTYMPAVLVNLVNNSQLGYSKEKRVSQALVLGLPFLAKVLKAHKNHLLMGKADPSTPLNFNKAAGVAKRNPIALNGEFSIDPDGNVCIDES